MHWPVARQTDQEAGSGRGQTCVSPGRHHGVATRPATPEFPPSPRQPSKLPTADPDPLSNPRPPTALSPWPSTRHDERARALARLATMDPGLVTILVGLVAASAALIGSRLTSRANEQTLKQAAALERSRWDREDSRRHEDARRQSYHAFLATVDEGVHGLNRLITSGDLDADFAGVGWQERLRDSLNVIEFVASAETIEAARLLDRAVKRLLGGVLGLRHVRDVQREEEDLAAEVGHGEGVVEENEETHGDGEIASEVDDTWRQTSWYSVRPGMAGLPGLNEFLRTLPYPLGHENAPPEFYGGGDPAGQIIMARGELRVRRQEFINAARGDLGTGEVPFPNEGRTPSRPYHT